jgi:5-methylthioadenosine/S-adenosylhomocysteine deaminase
VWSPHSNFELYGSTAEVAEAKQAGVTIAIAPDWSPTGSDGMLQELKYASVWNATQSPMPFTDRELFEMATLHAAQLGGIEDQAGTISVGKRADLLVLKPGMPSGDVYGALTHSSPVDVALLMVDGVPVYGDQQVMSELKKGQGYATISICGAAKTLNFQATEWTATSAELASALPRWGASLSPLADCR